LAITLDGFFFSDGYSQKKMRLKMLRKNSMIPVTRSPVVRLITAIVPLLFF
jgi:hypothetical protein